MLNLDIGKELSGGHIVHGRVGDNKSYTEKISVINEDGSPFDLTGLTITFMGNTHNFQTKVIDSDGAALNDAEKGLFQYTFPSEAFGVAGPYERAYFQFTNKNGVVATTGDFEVIVLDNADLNASEAETVISEFNKLIEELQKLQEENIADLKQQQDDYVVELSQAFAGIQTDLITLEGKINSYEASINETATEVQGTISGAVAEALDTVSQALDDFQNGNFWTKEESFNKEESSANVIDQIVSGKKEKIVFSTNFSGKVSGSLVENANSAYIAYSTALNAPTAGTWYEFSDERYSKISDLDDIRDVGSHKVNGQMVLIRIEYDVVDILTSVYSNNFWLSQGISTLDEKVTYIKNNVSEITPHVFGFGSGPSGNRLQLVTWRPDTKVWNDNGVTAINSTNQVKDIYAKHSPVVVDQYGKINILLYSYVSDGTIPSGTSIDYSELEIALNISANEHIESMFAANHGEKIATKEEALDGKSNDKIMTPLRVADVISTLGSGGNAVASSEEALAGVENTKIMSALRVKEVLDARENEIATSNVFSAAFMRSGQISFMRRGPILIVNGTVTVKTAQAALTDLFVPDLGGKVPLNNAGNILAISDKAPYTKRFLISSNGGNFRTISALEADEYLAFSGSIMLAP
nr:MAG TPA: distal tail protein [Caudoviricetes sp.]